MQNYITRVIYTFVCSVLLSLILFITPTLALDVDLGQQADSVVASNSIVQPPTVATPDSVILPGQSGLPLLEQLNVIYSPLKSVGYRKARDLLYSQIDNKDGIVEGIYSGYRVPISQTSSQPRQDATDGGINAEHVWPRSQGAKSNPAKSDMHHLFPARKEVNSARDNHPFADIPDDQTKSWYLDDQKESVKPSPQVIDLYSESYRKKSDGIFEPRESKKGDVARAMFYFQTIYPNRADDDFFNSQKETLCKWAEEDPIDSGEVERSHKIANTEQGNENPFVLDSTLPKRTYCN